MGDDFVTSRIDHALGNGDWMSKIGELVVNYANEGIFDFSPLILHLQPLSNGGKSPFRFFNHRTMHPQLYEMVGKAWKPTDSILGVW